MNKKAIPIMRPQDLVVLIKLVLVQDKSWTQISLAHDLQMSQSEISESISRSSYARLLFDKGRMVQKQGLVDFIQYGLPYAFPQQPGIIQRGIPTAQSAAPLKNEIVSEEIYIWPYSKGEVRGQSIQPLYATAIQASLLDSQLYELLALLDSVRVGRAREKNIAIDILKLRLL